MMIFVFWIVMVVIATMIGAGKGKAGFGFFMGFLLGPIGVIIVAIVSPNEKKVEKSKIESDEYKKCPFCAELIKKEAKICKHCGREQEDIIDVNEPIISEETKAEGEGA